MTGSEPSVPVSDVQVEKLRKIEIKWSIRLLGDRYGFILVIGLAAILAGIAGVWLFRSPSMGLLGFAMILAATADYWLGVRNKLDSNGASSRVGISVTSMEWKDVKRVTFFTDGVQLSPLLQSDRLESFRGVTLRSMPTNHLEVLEFVEANLPANAVRQTFEKALARF